MLSNLQSYEQALLRIILVSQPGIRATLRQEDLGSFSQRIAVNYHIEPLAADEGGGGRISSNRKWWV